MAADPWAKAQKRVARLAAKLGLPELTEGTSYGTPALLVKGKSFTRLKDPETLVLLVPLEQKELLLEMAPEIYYETDHYKGWPAVLIRLGAIGDEELAQRLADGWRHRAPKRLVAGAEQLSALQAALIKGAESGTPRPIDRKKFFERMHRSRK